MSGKLNKEEQIQVVIRIKPVQQQSQHTKTVYLSEQQQRTLVVQTPNKKEYFVFDSIADQNCTQSELYNQIGKDALFSSTEGYNCCIFAYGQTGAGKTHSILGATQEIAKNIYSDSRGILPRLLGDIFSWCQAEVDQWNIKCSYMEIYNEQIYDLLNTDEKLGQIREDIKKGVYVQGLSEEKAINYEQAMGVLLKGVKNRKVFATSMNNESSRSHTIFTLNLETEIKQDQSGMTRTRKSKLNIVDLAGSERAKQTKVEGDRLKQGCNINKSLHVLGNVINALVESSKKKKHIPFRDSKLTYYLKDSLCGNSITKLLANIHPSKAYLGDTLSTLMFAKRAKILKMKVQPNENVGENFEELRKEVRRLRQQLKQAKYIKNQVRTEKYQSERDTDQQFFQICEKAIDTSGFDFVKNQNVLQVFQENELNYKALIQIYEEHIKTCTQASSMKRKSNNMHHEWKVLERKNEAYKNLLKNMPAFTKIFKQNVLLKEEADQKKLKITRKQSIVTHKAISTQNIIFDKSPEKESNISREVLINLKEEYEKILIEAQEKFTAYINILENEYNELQHENSLKDARIKDLCRRKQLPPDMQELLNENQYLKLNVMELENEIAKLTDRQTKYQIQIKELRRENHEYHQHQEKIQAKEQSKTVCGGCQISHNENLPEQISLKVKEIEQTLQNQLESFEEERQQLYNYIDKLRQYTKKIIEDSKGSTQVIDKLKNQNKNLRNKIGILLKIGSEGQQISVIADIPDLNIQELNIPEEFQFFNKIDTDQQGNMQVLRRLLEKQTAAKNELEKEVEKQRGTLSEMSSSIVKLHHDYGHEISKLKQEMEKNYHQKQLVENLQLVEKKEKQINFKSQKKMFEVPKEEMKTISKAKSKKTLNKMKEEVEKRIEQAKKNIEKVNSGRKSALIKLKEEDHSSKYASVGSQKK